MSHSINRFILFLELKLERRTDPKEATIDGNDPI